MDVKTEPPNDTVSTDRIEKRVVLRAPRTRVWRALTNAAEFGTWFRVKLEGAFTEGRPIRGRLAIPDYEHLTLELLVERIDPERYFSYRWHPYAIDPAVDYSTSPRHWSNSISRTPRAAPPSRLSSPGSIASRLPVAPKRSA